MQGGLSSSLGPTGDTFVLRYTRAGLHPIIIQQNVDSRSAPVCLRSISLKGCQQGLDRRTTTGLWRAAQACAVRPMALRFRACVMTPPSGLALSACSCGADAVRKACPIPSACPHLLNSCPHRGHHHQGNKVSLVQLWCSRFASPSSAPLWSAGLLPHCRSCSKQASP